MLRAVGTSSMPRSISEMALISTFGKFARRFDKSEAAHQVEIAHLPVTAPPEEQTTVAV